MKRTIRIVVGTIELTAQLNDTCTAKAIWGALPLAGRVNIWGNEIYFPIPLRLEQECGQEVVEKGDLGYWPPGNAICIFFGPTPVSKGIEIRPASPVTVFGRVLGDVTQFMKAAEGMEIVIRRESDGQDS